MPTPDVIRRQFRAAAARAGWEYRKEYFWCAQELVGEFVPFRFPHGRRASLHFFAGHRFWPEEVVVTTNAFVSVEDYVELVSPLQFPHYNAAIPSLASVAVIASGPRDGEALWTPFVDTLTDGLLVFSTAASLLRRHPRNLVDLPLKLLLLRDLDRVDEALEQIREIRSDPRVLETLPSAFAVPLVEFFRRFESGEL